MKNLPLISIALPTYNSAAFVKSTVNSLLAQTYPNMEIVVSDDCSTDGTYENLKELCREFPKIRLYRNEKNSGGAKNWGKAISLCKGDFITVFNGDDLMNKDFISHCMDIFEGNPSADIVVTDHHITDQELNIKKVNNPRELIPEGFIEDFTLLNLTLGFPFLQQFALYKKSAYDKLSGINNNVLYDNTVNDAGMWHRVGIARLKVYYSIFKGGFYIKHGQNISNNKIRQFKKTTQNLMGFKKYYWEKYKKPFRVLLLHNLKNYMSYTYHSRSFVLIPDIIKILFAYLRFRTG